MPERDTGEDKTDKAADRNLDRKSLDFQNRMPFYESEPEVVYAPRIKGENE